MTSGRAGALLLLAVAFASPARAEDGVDALRYEIDVVLAGDGEMGATVAIDFTGGGKLELELASQMRVEKASVGSRFVDARHERDRLEVDTGSASSKRRRMIFRLSGRPHVQFPKSRGGFLRTTVGKEIAYIRNQYAWYPRVADDPAQYRIRFNLVGPAMKWRAQTCGTLREHEEGRSATIWTFETEREVMRAGLAAGPYRRVERKSEGGLTAAALLLDGDDASADHLLGVASRALDHYAARFGKIALPGYTIVEMPDAYGSGSGYGESGYSLIGAGAFRAAGEAPWADDLVAHEVSHLWFGEEVGFSDWISESLASWATLGFVEADDGPTMAWHVRRKAIEDFLAVAADGRGVAATDMDGFGGNMDPRTYRVHAYDEGAAMLSMIGDQTGPEQLDRRVAALIDANRGKTLDRIAVFEHLRGLGKEATALVGLWTGADVLTLTVEHAHTRKKVSGKILQTGAAAVPVELDVMALCGDEDAGARVPCKKAETGFSFKAPAAPDYFVVDPDYRVVAARPPPVGDVGDWVSAQINVANATEMRSRKRLERTLANLRRLSRLRIPEYEPVAHTGIARCLFRLGRADEAAAEFRTALDLGAGGPFHRSWCHLRLGCIDDLAGRPEEAKKRYERAVRGRPSQEAAGMARRFLERPYRGLAKDG